MVAWPPSKTTTSPASSARFSSSPVSHTMGENILRQKVEGALDQKNHLLVKVFNRRAITVDEIVDDLSA
jgi:hypothetical protein